MNDMFMCSEQDIAELRTYTIDIKNVLRDTYIAGNRFFNTVKISEDWKGEQKNAFVGFMDLVMQYHGRLNGEHGVGNNPTEQAEQTLTEFLNEFNTFYLNSSAYKELEGIE